MTIRSPGSYLDTLRFLSEAGDRDRPEWNLVVLRDMILEPVLTTYLHYFALQRGFRLNVHYSNYNTILQHIEDDSNERMLEAADCIIIFTRLESISSRLSHDLLVMSETQAAEEKAEIRRYTESVLASLRKRTDTMILWSGFDPQVHACGGILDALAGITPTAVLSDLNRQTSALVKGMPNAYYFDLPQLVMRIGAGQFFDPRGKHAYAAPYSRAGCEAIASEIVRYMAASKGLAKKCLVLDCDDTLWGGVVAEDGLAGIRIGTGRYESAYLEFQQEIVNLHRRGVILALCSKNDEADVWEVFDHHPGMLLKRHHFSSVHINWEPKSVNLERIAKALRVDLSSMVMVDDNPFEIEQIRSMLPEVETISLNAQQPYLYAPALSTCGYFDTLSLSEEDRSRGAMYKDEAKREAAKSLFANVTEYLGSLDMQASVKRAAPSELGRIAQLCQRTNQFNLHVRRYTVHELEKLSQDPDTTILALRLKDRFGDYGLVGVCILRRMSESMRVDSFLLSCRAIGRGVEEVLLDAAVRVASSGRCRQMIGLVKETNRNGAFASYYQRKGFRLLKTVDQTSHWKLELQNYVFQTPPYMEAKLELETAINTWHGRTGRLT